MGLFIELEFSAFGNEPRENEYFSRWGVNGETDEILFS